MRTIVKLNDGRRFELRRSFYRGKNYVPVCERCDCSFGDGCLALEEGFFCSKFDTEKSAVYLKELATPSISSDTPSEARREAAAK